MECVAPLLATKALTWVAAQNIYTDFLGYLVPESFEPNCRIRHSPPPQERRAFPTSCNMGLLPPCRILRCRQESTRDLPKLDWIRNIIDHECGECLGNIQRDVVTISNRCVNIQALCLQFVVKDISV